MKYNIFLLTIFALVISAVGCKEKSEPVSSEDTEVTPPQSEDPVNPPQPETLAEKICGEWHYVSADGDVDIYIEFTPDDSFELYQKFQGGVHHLYKGQWTLTDNTIEGQYKDGTMWQSSYQVAVNEDKTALTLTNSESGETIVYSKESIPDSVKDSCIVEVKSSFRILNSQPQYCWL